MIKELIENQINKQKKLYTIVSIVFFVGVFLGVACINNLELELVENLKEYFSNFQKAIANMDNDNLGNLFINSCISKFKYIGIIFVLACTIIWGTFIYALVLYKGFSIGYVISAIIKVYGMRKGIVFALSVLCVQNIIYIPCILFFVVYSINFCKMIKTKNVNIKILLLKYFMIFLIILIISSIASMTELLISYKIFKKIQIFY